jgi:hypothetical protein
MTITYDIEHVIATTEFVNVEVAEKSAMSLVSSTTDPKTGEVMSVYALTTGDPSRPATVTYRSSHQERKTGNIHRISVTLDTYAVKTDSVTGIVQYAPISATLSVNAPDVFQIETADLDDLVGNMLSLLYPSVSAGVRSTAWLAKLNFGVTQVS